MRDKKVASALTARELKALADPSSNLDEMMVTRHSRVHDLVWRFPRKFLPRGISPSKLQIEWEHYDMSEGLRRQLQRILAISYKSPKSFGRRGYKVANSFCQDMKCGLRFICLALSYMPDRRIINGIADLTMHDLRKAAKASFGSAETGVKRALTIIFHPFLSKIIGAECVINSHDIRSLEFKTPNSRGEDALWFPDELFNLLSEQSAARVQDFLKRMLEDAKDLQVLNKYTAPAEIRAISNFREVFESYCVIRQKGQGAYSTRMRLRKQGLEMDVIRRYVKEINAAAITIIALYTGGRYSELSTLKLDCLETRDEVLCLVGKVFKGRPDNSLIDDTWVAVPIIEDAVKALTLIAPIKQNVYLISPTEHRSGIGVRGKVQSYARAALSRLLKFYLEIIDEDEIFTDWHFTTHQFKHSLARQLVKAKLGLPYISYQMKHLHNRCTTLPSDVTLRYGNSAKLLHAREAGLHLVEIKRGIADAFFDPSAPVAGGGAEKFKARRKSYFEGLMASGYTKEQIIDRLAESGVDVFVDVGLAYCSGKERDEDNKVPPCIGSLQCNPSKCTNAIVTEQHIAAWRLVASENKRRIQDQRFFYARESLGLAVEEAEGVLQSLSRQSKAVEG